MEFRAPWCALLQRLGHLAKPDYFNLIPLEGFHAHGFVCNYYLGQIRVLYQRSCTEGESNTSLGPTTLVPPDRHSLDATLFGDDLLSGFRSIIWY